MVRDDIGEPHGDEKSNCHMNVLLIGSGGREHALAWALAASPIVSKLYCAPGNAGIAEVAECVPIAATDIDRIVAFARERSIAFVVIGPEAPLVAGLWDRLEANGIKALGPSAKAAQLEGSKGFVKELCRAHKIPTAHFARFENPDAAIAYVTHRPHPLVVKADGLAQGKGVVVAQTPTESIAAIKAHRRFPRRRGSKPVCAIRRHACAAARRRRRPQTCV
jgi:phosphoribosylamine--glycine ligase